MATEITDIDITEADIIADLLAAYPVNVKPDETWIDADGAARVWKVGVRTAKTRLEELVSSGAWEVNRSYIGINGKVKSYYRKSKRIE